MSLATTYLAGLRSRLPGHDLEQLQLAHGASAADVHRLLERYPLCPPGLLQLLEQFDGTQCWGSGSSAPRHCWRPAPCPCH